jgi:superfamily II DNA or RNA helicase
MNPNTIVLERVNEVYLKVKEIELGQAYELKEFFTCYATNFMFQPKYKSGDWDGKISFYHLNDKLLSTGLLPAFTRYCKKYGYNYKLDFDATELSNNVTEEEIQNFYKLIFNDTKYFPREYQHKAIFNCIKNKRGVVEHPTASGKSLNIYTLIRFILGIKDDAKILLVVPTIGLVNQMFSDFHDYGWQTAETYCSLIYGTSKKRDWRNPIIISTWQSIYNKPEEYFTDFDAVIVDETHGAKCTSIQSVLKKCINAEYRIGFTATLPNKKTQKSDVLTIFGYLGPIISQVKSKELIDKGFLSKIKIANIILKHPDETIEDLRKVKNSEIEIGLINKEPRRNKVLNYIIDHINPDHNVLILCNRIDKHLKIVEKYINENFPNKKLYVIHGETEADEREVIRKEMNEKNGIILLASYGTMTLGINIPKIHHIISLTSFRSEIKILQIIGRGLRKHDSKDQLIFWDIVDDLTYLAENGQIYKNYVYKHWLMRLSYYKNQGYKYFNKKLNIEKL